MAPRRSQESEAIMEVYAHLRDEIVSMQKVRAQLYVFKVTGLGAIYYLAASAAGTAEQRSVEGIVAVALAPLLAAMLDFVIEGHSLAVKEIGHYIRTQIEPSLFEGEAAPFVPYELYLATPHGRVPLRRGLATKLVTIVTLIVSAIALSPVRPFGERLYLAGTWFMLWLTLSVALLVIVFFWHRVPIDWLRVRGRGGEHVLITGWYRGICCRCKRVVGSGKSFERGSQFDDLRHANHPKPSTFQLFRTGLVLLCRWLARSSHAALHERRKLREDSTQRERQTLLRLAARQLRHAWWKMRAVVRRVAATSAPVVWELIDASRTR